ncbi:hypothetical protein CPB83DRAFT_837754 [Crepidotus variabilis]|uniref:Uncharacterized protein n=1 Tax=Crepidotus variabilis TaxID=179855 RepID=A0A9P6JMS2_9AGAR|nr:hypothetical protein CPB83DRAFT_837754 [Crepidotus variabilis]
MVSSKVAPQSCTSGRQPRIQREVSKALAHWSQIRNKFGNTNENKFEDRKWLHNVLPELIDGTKADAGAITIAEVGYDAGNSAFPLLSSNQDPAFRIIIACNGAGSNETRLYERWLSQITNSWVEKEESRHHHDGFGFFCATSSDVLLYDPAILEVISEPCRRSWMQIPTTSSCAFLALRAAYRPSSIDAI